MKIEYFCKTGVGNRDVNEDCYAVSEHNDSFCFVLADGLGGHQRGELASQNAVETVSSLFSKEGYYNTFFQDAFSLAHKSIIDIQNTKKADMKTTIVSLVVEKNRCYWAHIGDSRLYAFRSNEMLFRTKDHSVPQKLAMIGSIKESEIRCHPDRNRLLKVLGDTVSTPDADVAKAMRIAGECCFLLCSDGFWEPISDETMLDSLKKSNSMENWVNDMENKIVVNQNKGDLDNYTAIAIRAKTDGLWGLF